MAGANPAGFAWPVSSFAGFAHVYWFPALLAIG